jgi:hypothetical protein
MSDTKVLDDVIISGISDHIVDHIWPLLSGIRALIVMDGKVGSSHYATFGAGDLNPDPINGGQYFGLSEFIRTLTDPSSKFTRVLVTRAHRETDVRGAADIEHFRFDAHDLSVYDEIFLFGVAPHTESNTPMSEAELGALAAFMDGGGGVFATGDHEDLGVMLCGRVPRVRSMRKWYFPNLGPLGEPVAPPAIGTERVETTQLGHNEYFVHFDDQSDDIPQPLALRWYSRQLNIFTLQQWPHPLLCGLHGAIKVAPDHMHEGEVIEPWDTTAKLIFNGKTFVEYPAGTYGERPLPEIVAWGKVLAEADVSTEPAHTGDPSNVARPRTFGVVGAYDGHRAGVGRVAVDSTWHHFFDINLIGDPVAPFPKTQGFNASPVGQEALADIRAYYRNLTTWLARPAALSRIFAGMAWYALRTQGLAMAVNPRFDYSHADLINIGALAQNIIARIAPPCSVLLLLIPYFVDGPTSVPPPDPWAGPQPGDPPFLDPAIYLRAALGGAIVALAAERAKLTELEPQLAARAIQEATRKGVFAGLRSLGRDLGGFAEGIEQIARGLMNQSQSAGSPQQE